MEISEEVFFGFGFRVWTVQAIRLQQREREREREREDGSVSRQLWWPVLCLCCVVLCPKEGGLVNSGWTMDLGWTFGIICRKILF